MNRHSRPPRARPDRRALLAALAGLVVAPRLAFATDAPGLPPDSVYHARVALEDAGGRAFALEALQGDIVLAGMFYASCPFTCPTLFETVHATLRALPADVRGEVRVLMATLDPARDSGAVLQGLARSRGCDARWTLARGDAAATRTMAALLDVQYRVLPDGEISHSSRIVALDRLGRVVAATGRLGGADPAVVAAVRAAAARGG